MTTTYGLAKAINAVLMTLAAIPVYLWAGRLVPRLYALLAGGADAVASVALLHRDADDGERVLPGLRNRRLRDCAGARAADAYSGRR